MRDGVNDFAAFLYPAEGLEPASKLFTAPPIESLEWLKELGDIARASFVTESAPATATASESEAPQVKPQAITPPAPKSADEKLLEALLEYHRLRGPTLGARTLTATPGSFSKTDSSTIATRESGFSSVDIPVVQDYVPKTSASPHRSSQPVHTVLKSKQRP